ncbi:MAG: TetR/AcrR family transcriptional regulator [Bacteroidota bacterium]
MANPKFSQDEVIIKLMDVFRKVGYDGASLSELANATGLKKASLYHRFPGGKKEMAEVVLAFVDGWVEENITRVLFGKGSPETRLRKVFTNIDQLYTGGKNPCVLESMAAGSGLPVFQQTIGKSFADIAHGFAHLARGFGFTPKRAEKMGMETLIRIQGALIVAQGTSDLTVFGNTIKDLKKQFRSVN